MDNADDFIESLRKFNISEKNANGSYKSVIEILKELAQVFKEAGYEIE